jgi:F0F1-type ATP synthase assembly protein I
MSPTREKNINARQEVIPEKLGQAYLIIGVVTFILGSFFILFGLWIDRISGKYPIFTIVMMAISFPLILFINFKIIKKSIEKLRL